MYNNYPSGYPYMRPPVPPPPVPQPAPPPPNWDWGFHRVVSLLQSPPTGAGILAVAFFFVLVFSSNVILSLATTLKLLGAAVTISTFALIAVILVILFVL